MTETVCDSESIEELTPGEEQDDSDEGLASEMDAIHEELIGTLERTNLEGITVFNVDDDAFVLNAGKRGFGRAKASYQSASNGEEALAAFEALPLESFVLLDNNLGSGIRGVDVARKMKAQRPDLFIIFTSGNPESGLVAKLMAEKILDDSFPKPYDINELVAYIIRQLDR